MQMSNYQKQVQILRNPEKSANIISKKNLMPFELEWSFGWNSEIGLINVSEREMKSDKLHTFFVSAHVGVILEYNLIKKSKYMKMLTGHRNPISSFDANLDGSRLVTADRGDKESRIIVWDYLHRTPVFTLSPPSSARVAIVKFSIDSKFLITVSTDTDGEQTIDLWDWQSGKEESICSTKLDNSIDTIIHLTCCYDNPNFFCLTTKKEICFMTLEKQSKEITITVPKLDPKHKRHNYSYTQSAYVTHFRQVVSANTGGFVTIWDDTNYNVLKIKNTPITNQKQFLKVVKLDDHAITTIICQTYIITGNTNGDVFFYDKSLRILYHLEKFVGDPIVSVAALTNNNTVEIKINKTTIESENVEHKNQNSVLDDESSSRQPSIICTGKPRIGIALTAQKDDFKFDPFFISTRNRKIFYVNTADESFIQIFEECDVGVFTALEVHPKKNSVILGNSIGKLSMYDYQTKMLIKNTVGSLDINDQSPVTSIKYSFNGRYLCYGCMDGSFWFLDPNKLTPMITNPFKWDNSPVNHITFSKFSNYVVYTDNLFGIYLYGIQDTEKFDVQYYGCCQFHTGVVRGISITEYKTGLTVYSTGADHRIAIYEFNKTRDEHLILVKSMKTESWNEPQCMMKSSFKKKLNLIISGSDLRLCVWDKNRCIRTTMGVNLDTPIRVMKDSYMDKSIMFFCNDTDIGLLRQPIDGNPYKNAAILASGTKMINIEISNDIKYLFSISENSTSMFMWSINTRYLDKLEEYGGIGLKAYSSLLEGGEKGSEINLFKDYFYSVQLANSLNPETVVLKDYVDVCEMSFIMRAMGYFPSETELSNMLYEMYMRPSKGKTGHSITLVTFEELVILYLNFKPQRKMKFGEIRKAFAEIVLNDPLAYGESDMLTRETFVDMMINKGSKIDCRELEIIIHTLLKTTSEISSGSRESIDLVQSALPYTFTFEEMMTQLFGFLYTNNNE